MKTTTEHLAVGTEVFIVDYTETHNARYYRWDLEKIQEVGIGKGGVVTYYFESAVDMEEDWVFLTREEAEQFIITKLREENEVILKGV